VKIVERKKNQQPNYKKMQSSEILYVDSHAKSLRL
jgi:hypothetical protein